MLLDKPQGELVHSNLPDEKAKEDEICLVDRFIGYLYKKGEYNPQNEQSFVPSLCNRLDRNTCGIVIAAKNAASLRIMNDKVKMREMVKTYHALCYGVPKQKQATLKHFHYKDRKNNRVYIYDTVEQAKKLSGTKYDDDIKTVITKYKTVRTDGEKSLLEVELITGRTHQIRAHLAYIGCPIVGDGKYGVNHKSKTGVKYQMLCSHKLKFEFKTESGILSYLDGKEFCSRFDFEL
jgi:23S rRNA pseudouridine955/2504/2580 synthase